MSDRTFAAVLTGGPVSWADFSAQGRGLCWMWQDLDGWNVASLPDSAPDGVTHLWGSSPGMWMVARMRPDGGLIAASLVESAIGGDLEVGDGGGGAGGGERVECVWRDVDGWRQGDLRVDPSVTGGRFGLIEVLAPTPLVFVDVESDGNGRDG